VWQSRGLAANIVCYSIFPYEKYLPYLPGLASHTKVIRPLTLADKAHLDKAPMEMCHDQQIRKRAERPSDRVAQQTLDGRTSPSTGPMAI
jgi:hypothetical protein